MSRRVDQVDRVRFAMVLPWAGSRGRLNRDATLLLFLKEVHRRGAFMHFANLVTLAGVVQDTLSDGGFASVDMGANADVSDESKICGHWTARSISR